MCDIFETGWRTRKYNMNMESVKYVRKYICITVFILRMKLTLNKTPPKTHFKHIGLIYWWSYLKPNHYFLKNNFLIKTET